MTNRQLFKMKQSENFVCRLCHESEETIIHLFVFCPKSNEFCESTKSWIFQNTNKNFVSFPSHIIFGVWEDDCSDNVVNIITITGKYYIFKCARSNRSLNFFEYEKYLRNVYNEQLLLAKTEILVEKFSEKWSVLIKLCN